MSKSVILNFGSGSLEAGFSINVQIYNDLNLEPEVSDCFDLPPSPDFDETYKAWKELIGSEEDDKKKKPDCGYATRGKSGGSGANTQADFIRIAGQFREQINNWLGSHGGLEQCIRTPLLPKEEIKIIVNGKDRRLQRLPWHLWKLFDEFAQAEIAFSEPPAIKAGNRDSSRDELNILTILGSDGGIDVRQDLEVIKNLPANVVALSKPSRSEISDELWDKSWDILFFSGHSNTVDGKGIIHINDTESMTIEELKNGLRKAIANGLRLAIFNSCDGLGFAWELKEARLQIPQLIVMREPVPDVVAQKFARYFLSDLAKNVSFYRAFRNARERLKEEFQDIHLHADWLPIAFQNPTQKVFSWKNEDSKVVDWTGLISDYQQKQLELTSNRLSGKHENLPLIDLGLVERKKDKSVDNIERDGSPDAEEREVITNYDNSTFFSEVLEQGNTPKQQGRIAIAGEPGAGKTTFLQQIASRVLERDWGIPIWISLKDIGTIAQEAGDKNKLQDYIYTSWLSLVLNKPLQLISESETAALTKLFEESKIWLLLDGLDEMRVTGVQSALSAINQQLNNLSFKSPHRIVITCRQNLLNATSSNSLTSFDTFYTQKFNPQQIEQFIDNWFIQLPEYATELKQQLAEPQYENINYLIVNPLLLTMLCVIYERRQGADLGSLPETRAGLYREFIAYYYNWKNEEFAISRADKDKLEKDILGKIALWGLKNSSSRYSLLEEELKEFLQTEYNWQGEELYDWLFKLENTWLQKIGFARQDTTQAAYAFLHPTFQEYFAATTIDDYDFFLPKNHVNKPVPGKEYRIFEDKWLEVILLWIGRKNIDNRQKEEFVKSLFNFDDGLSSEVGNIYKREALLLAGYCVSEFDSTLSHEIYYEIFYNQIAYSTKIALFRRERAIHSLLEILENNNIDKAIRCYVAENLSKISPEHRKDACIILQEILQDRSVDLHLRFQAFESLYNLAPNNKAIISDLISLLKDREAEKMALYILGVETIKSVLKHEQNADLITALVEISSDKSTEVFYRRELIEAFSYIKTNNKSVIDAFVAIIKKSSYSDLFYSIAIDILCQIVTSNRDIFTELIKAVKNKHTNQYISLIRFNVLYMVDNNNKDAIKTLLGILEDNTNNEQITCDALLVLREMAVGNKEAISVTINVLKNNYKNRIGSIAMETIGKIAFKNQDAIDTLNTLTKALKQEIAEKKSTIHNHAKSSDIIEDVFIFLYHFKETVKTRDFTMLNGKSVDEYFIDRNNSYLIEATTNLIKISPDNKEVLNTLIDILKDKTVSIRIRNSAAYNLAEIALHNKDAIGILVKILEDKIVSNWTRIYIAKKIAILAPENKEPISALVEVLKDKSIDRVTRQDLAYFLSKTHSENNKAFFALVRFLKDKSIDKSSCCKTTIINNLTKKKLLNYTNFYQLFYSEVSQKSLLKQLQSRFKLLHNISLGF